MFNMRFQNTTQRHKVVEPGGVPEHAKCLVLCHWSHIAYDSGEANLADGLKIHGILFIELVLLVPPSSLSPALLKMTKDIKGCGYLYFAAHKSCHGSLGPPELSIACAMA